MPLLQAWYQGKNNSLSLSKDGDIFYYKTAGEEAMEMTEGEMAAARKRATIESRKKKQAKTSKRDGPETGVVMRVARGDEASPTSAEQEATGKGDPPVVGLVANATTTSDVVQVAVPVVEADDHRAEVRVERPHLSNICQHMHTAMFKRTLCRRCFFLLTVVVVGVCVCRRVSQRLGWNERSPKQRGSSCGTRRS